MPLNVPSSLLVAIVCFARPDKNTPYKLLSILLHGTTTPEINLLLFTSGGGDELSSKLSSKSLDSSSSSIASGGVRQRRRTMSRFPGHGMCRPNGGSEG